MYNTFCPVLVLQVFFFMLDEVQKKFGGAKGISSDQLFGTTQVWQ